MTDIPGLGHNMPPLDLDGDIRDRHARLFDRANEIIAACAECPLEITDDTVSGQAGDLIREARTAWATIEQVRKLEKEPWAKAASTVDATFKGPLDAVTKAVAPVIKANTCYLEAKRDAERRRREAELRKQREERERLEKAAAKARSEARQQEIADSLQRALANETKLAKAAEAGPAELSRTRGEFGSVASLSKKWTFLVEDYALVPIEQLRGFFTEDEIDKAVARYVRAGGRDLPGVRIFEETISRVV